MFVDMQSMLKTTVKQAYDSFDKEHNDEYAFSELNNDNNDEVHKNSFGDMAENSRAKENVCNISFDVTRRLSISLDTDRGWETLAAVAGFTFERIQHLGLRLNQPNGSPTRSLLWELGTLNYTVADLYDKLKSATRLREMQILEEYVNEVRHEGKGAEVEKKIAESSLFASNPKLLSQIMAPEPSSFGRPESVSTMSNSEINFNQLSFVAQGKTNAPLSKNYEDKIIPGKEDQSVSRNPLQEVNYIGRSSSVMTPHIPLPTEHLRQDKYGSKSLPPSFLPSSFGKIQDGAPSYGGADNIQQILSNSSIFTSSTNSRASSRDVKPHMSPKAQEGTEENSPLTYNTVFSHRTLYNATAGFSENRVLGEGAFGKVYFGTINQQDCAIKILHSTTTDTEKKPEQVKSELAVLSKYRHENIVILFGYSQNDSELYLIYQYLPNGSLEDRLMFKNNTPPLNWERRLNILVGICRGLNYLHNLGGATLIHGDIKSANILLDQYFEPKIGDLGQAKYATSQSSETTGLTHITVAESKTKLFGTKAYMSPELLSSGALSVKSDIYALGVVFLEVCTGLKAYDPNRHEHTFLADHFMSYVSEKVESFWKEVFQDKTLVEVPDDIFIEVLKVAKRCVSCTKKARPDTSKLLSEMKDIYKRNKDIMKEDGNPFSSLSTSLQIDSCRTVSTRDLSNMSTGHCEDNNSAQFNTYVFTKHNDILQEQQKRLQQFETIKSSSSQHQSQSSLQESQRQKVGHLNDLRLNIHTEDTVELRRNPDNPLLSFPPNTPIPEAFRLQVAYDCQPERRIDRLSQLSQNQEHFVEDYPSDPEKLQKLDEFYRKDDKCIQGELQMSSQLPDNFPQADPKKLAQLNAYDEANFGKSSHEDEPASLECDPVKIAYLKSFDDNLYKSSLGKYSSETNERADQAVNLTENVTQVSGRQTLPEHPTDLPHNSTTDLASNVGKNSLVSRPGLSSHNTNGYDGVGSSRYSESHSGMENMQIPHHPQKNFRFEKDADHNGNCQPSGGNTTDNESTKEQIEQVHMKPKPGIKKMESFFTRYKDMKDRVDSDDD